MKKGYQYEINHLTNTVTVTKSFMQNSAYLDTKEYKLMKRFLGMGYKVEIQKVKRKSSAKIKDMPKVTYKMMRGYIALCEDAKPMLEEFEKIREVSTKQQKPYQYVLKWFHEEFPNYSELPEFDENLKVVHNPNKKSA